MTTTNGQNAASQPETERPSTTVSKPTPYVYDLCHLTAIDPNPLPSSSHLLSLPSQSRNTILQTTARDGAQSLITTLLTTTTITTTPDSLLMNLPTPSPFPLPRWKPLPKPPAPTKWETFARKKGIGKFGGNRSGGAALEDRKKNLVYDEEKGEWVKKWGYKGKNKSGEGDWLVELDDKKVKKEAGLENGMGIRGEGRRERKERIRRQERKERNNSRKVPRKV